MNDVFGAEFLADAEVPVSGGVSSFLYHLGIAETNRSLGLPY